STSTSGAPLDPTPGPASATINEATPRDHETSFVLIALKMGDRGDDDHAQRPRTAHTVVNGWKYPKVEGVTEVACLSVERFEALARSCERCARTPASRKRSWRRSPACRSTPSARWNAGKGGSRNPRRCGPWPRPSISPTPNVRSYGRGRAATPID